MNACAYPYRKRHGGGHVVPELRGDVCGGGRRRGAWGLRGGTQPHATHGGDEALHGGAERVQLSEDQDLDEGRRQGGGAGDGGGLRQDGEIGEARGAREGGRGEAEYEEATHEIDSAQSE